MYYYAGFGTEIKSEIPFPFTTNLTLTQPLQLQIRIGNTQQAFKTMEKINPGIAITENALAIHTPTIATFLITKESITIEAHIKSNDLTLQTFILHSILPYWLTLHNKVILKGHAFTRDHHTAILQLDQNSCLKEITNNASLLSSPYILLSKHKNKIYAEPGFPILKIWENETKKEGINLKTITKTRNNLTQYHWPIPEKFQKKALPINTLIFEKTLTLKNDPKSKTLTGFQKIPYIIPTQMPPIILKKWHLTNTVNNQVFQLANQANAILSNPPATTL